MPTTAGTSSADSYGSLRWYLWDGGFLVLGRSPGILPLHEHHAIQIVLGMEAPVSIGDERGNWRNGLCLIIKPDVPHSLDSHDAAGGVLFVDPESREGQWLCSALTDDITVVPPSRSAPLAAELRAFVDRPFEAMELRALIRHCVHSLCTGAPPAARFDQRITRVLQDIRASDDLRVSQEAIAASVFLSASRFAHLFKQQVGLPFRRYMLWRKLTRALVAMGREGSAVTAAHAAGFADAAHLTRTFQSMFGLTPSAMLRGKLFEIGPPFELLQEGEATGHSRG